MIGIPTTPFCQLLFWIGQYVPWVLEFALGHCPV